MGGEFVEDGAGYVSGDGLGGMSPTTGWANEIHVVAGQSRVHVSVSTHRWHPISSIYGPNPN
jgi:hypothetical protein